MNRTVWMVAVWLTAAFAAVTQAATPASTGTVAMASTSQQSSRYLTVFTNGIGKGMHAVYEAPNFDALMQSNGYVLVYPKNKGVRIGQPMSMGLHTYYHGNVITMGRPIVSFEDDKGPLMNPASVTLTGKLQDDVDFSITYDFDKTGASIRGHAKDPQGLAQRTIFRLYIGVPAYTNFPPETLQTDREARLKGLSIVIKSGQKKYVYPYANSAVFASPSDKSWIEGPVYGPRKISFETKSPKSAPMNPWIYTHTAPHRGYAFYMYKKEMESKKPMERLVLTIQ